MPNHANGIRAEVGADDQRLRVVIADAPDGRRAAHFVRQFGKLGAERRVLNVVDLPLKPEFRVVSRNARAPRSEVGMVVHPEKDIEDTIPCRRHTEKTAHKSLSGLFPKKASAKNFPAFFIE